MQDAGSVGCGHPFSGGSWESISQVSATPWTVRADGKQTAHSCSHFSASGSSPFSTLWWSVVGVPLIVSSILPEFSLGKVLETIKGYLPPPRTTALENHSPQNPKSCSNRHFCTITCDPCAASSSSPGECCSPPCQSVLEPHAPSPGLLKRA